MGSCAGRTVFREQENRAPTGETDKANSLSAKAASLKFQFRVVLDRLKLQAELNVKDYQGRLAKTAQQPSLLQQLDHL